MTSAESTVVVGVGSVASRSEGVVGSAAEATGASAAPLGSMDWEAEEGRIPSGMARPEESPSVIDEREPGRWGAEDSCCAAVAIE